MRGVLFCGPYNQPRSFLRKQESSTNTNCLGAVRTPKIEVQG